MQWLRNVFSNFSSWFALPRVTFTDILEIVIITILVYHLILLVKNTRTWFVLRGIIVLFAAIALAALLQLNTILFLVKKSLSVFVIALLIVFQPELRRALEHLGRRKILARLFLNGVTKELDGFGDEQIDAIVSACFELGSHNTGALIVMEREIPLVDYIRTGIALDAVLSSPLLINIFEHNTPLHDGAVIIQGDRVSAATCYLPLSMDPRVSKELGTRHRAGLGISEVTDSITIIVSEETGRVSVAEGGALTHNISEKRLRKILGQLKPEETSARFRLVHRKDKNEKDTDE